MRYWIKTGQHLFMSTDFWPKLENLIYQKLALVYQQNKKADVYTSILNTLPQVEPSVIYLDRDRVTIGVKNNIDRFQAGNLQGALKQLIPWRKGPFELFGTLIDSEWVSPLKWNRLEHHIAPLLGRRILDIGCSNGYYMFRMAAHQPELILGLEPYPLFFTQFLLMQHFAGIHGMFAVPAKLEELTFCNSFFDTVFCMGILYHQRAPLDALNQIHSQMQKGGELVLETLIIPGDTDTALFPAKRYAKMNNIYFIPTINCLTHWLRRSGFENIRCIAIDKTTAAEQRKTQWIRSQSLDDFLDPSDPDLTVEGYPAPTRAIMLANSR